MQFTHAAGVRTGISDLRDRVLQQQQERATAIVSATRPGDRMITEVGVPSGLDCHRRGFLLPPFTPFPLSRQRSSRVWLGNPQQAVCPYGCEQWAGRR